MSELKKVVVFIPAWDEEERIGGVIEAIRARYQESSKKGYEVKILVVNDGSLDSTLEVAQKAGVDKIVSHPINMGLGAATRTGMETAYEMGADIAVKIDADFQHDPDDIHNVIQPILKNEADIVYGSRFAGQINYRMPLVRFLGNKFFTWLMRRITGWKITDAQTGMMVYSRRYLAVFNMPGNYNPPQQTLFDAYLKHMRYAEVPVVFHARTAGKSFISFKYPFKVIPQLLSVMMMVEPLFIFGPVGLFSIFVGLTLGFVEVILINIGAIDYFHRSTILILVVFGFQSLFFGLLADLIKNLKLKK